MLRTGCQIPQDGNWKSDLGHLITARVDASYSRTDSLDYPPRVLSGIQPTRGAHLGHYFGALKHHIDLHHEYPGQSFFLIADYHALTRGKEPKVVSEGSIEIATIYLSLGLDPTKAVLFRQSDVPAVCELSWILSCLTPFGWLTRAPVFKSAPVNDRSAGLLAYPVLQAADIFSVQATIVPVGQDQLPYIETARNLALRFNRKFSSPFFPVPEPKLSPYPIVKGTDGRKMHPSYDNRIFLFDRFDRLRESVASIKTDSKGAHDKKDPETCTVFHLYSLVASNDQVEIMRERYESGTISYAEAKRELTLAIQEYFSEYQEKYEKLKADHDYVLDILREGFTTAKDETAVVLDNVRHLVGLREFNTVSIPNARFSNP